jgi:hypothetical protein
MTSTPEAPQSIEQLEDMLSEPTVGVIQTCKEITGDVLILGIGGKMGPTLGRMMARASKAAGVTRRIWGVSRFSQSDLRDQLEAAGVETIACDLLDEQALAALPAADHVIYMTGFKFGIGSNPAFAWAMNCYLPALICRRFSSSRIAAFSSGNVYGMTPVAGGGSVETDQLDPTGEYAVTVLGRERMFEYFSRELQIPMVLLRLNYATEMRYGVLVDVAERVKQQDTIDVSMGYVNVIWQRDANAMSIQSLTQVDTPPRILNIAGPEILQVRQVAETMAQRMGTTARFTGKEADDAFLSNAQSSYELFGRPSVSAEQLIRWTADWVTRGGENLGKPTHFENRAGKY